jgi:hypothetical protein
MICGILPVKTKNVEYCRNWGTPEEIERRRRIKISVWAYAYEIQDNPVVPDVLFDVECYQVNLSINTDRIDLDCWFNAYFQPHTGVWIRSHPELDKIKQLYERFYR